MIQVIKRDGRKDVFDPARICDAVYQASASIDRLMPLEFVHGLARSVQSQLATIDRPEVSIDDIQKMVEDYLMVKYPDVARAYIEYRHDRDTARDLGGDLSQGIMGLVDRSDTSLMNENANKDSKVIPTQRDLLAGIAAKHHAKTHMLPRDIVAAHEAGDIHYHDLDYAPFFPMFNCMLIDLGGMLTNGFKMGNAEITSPRSITTATAVTAQIIAQVASHIYGGNTINRIDEVLAPYVTKTHEKNLEIAEEWVTEGQREEFALQMTEKQCFDAFQSLEYEVNTLHTANGQTPFVTFGFGLGTSWESRLIQKSILQNRIAGLGVNAKTAVFPKLVFALKDGLNLKPSDENYDIKQLALECATKRMYPDVLNYDKLVEVTGSFKTPMGCRSFLGPYEENGELIHEGRNNLGVVSINVPRIALKAQGNFCKFFSMLDEQLALTRRALDTRLDRLRGVKASVAPILYMEGACGVRLKADDDVMQIFENGRASISVGYIGINEAVNAMFEFDGEEEHMYHEDGAQAFGLDIVKRMKKAVDDWKAETGFGFSLYSTPSENLCSRFCAIDKAEFGDIPGVTGHDYYTNSFHLDVAKKVNPYDKIDFEMEYPAITNGGFICYGEYPNMQNNVKALEDVWDYAYPRVPYYGTNTPIDECYECGFTGEFNCTSKGFACPNCGCSEAGRISVTRRVCGYLGSPDARPFNFGKQAEVQRRVKHI